MARRWLILADDLTGAADAGVAFAQRGISTEVVWQEVAPADDSLVVACDLDSRGLSPARAAERHRAAVHRLLATDCMLYKKIDSTLRGQPAAEVAALCAVLRELRRPAFGICAPANPAMGRITRDGRVLVNGQPLEQTETWRHEHNYPDADLATIFASAGLEAVKVPLSTVRRDAPTLRAALQDAAGMARGAALAICDAASVGDLERIAQVARDLPAVGFFVGTAGLAQALAATESHADTHSVTLAPTTRGTLVAVGSRARVSRLAAVRLAESLGTSTIRVEPAGAGDGPSKALFALSICARLYRGEVAVALLDAAEPDDGRVNPRYVEFFAETLRPALEQMGALIVSGGETAAALLAQAGVRSIRLLDEIEPGIALGVTCGDIETPIVTKPGAFGDEDSLIRCVQRLQQLRSAQ